MSPAALRALADAADALARLARAALAEDGASPAALLPLRVAAERAGASVRTLRDAIRLGDLPAFGKQRSRVVRAADLATWIESRKVRSTEGADDADMDRRVARLARGGKP